MKPPIHPPNHSSIHPPNQPPTHLLLGLASFLHHVDDDGGPVFLAPLDAHAQTAVAPPSQQDPLLVQRRPGFPMLGLPPGLPPLQALPAVLVEGQGLEGAAQDLQWTGAQDAQALPLFKSQSVEVLRKIR